MHRRMHTGWLGPVQTNTHLLYTRNLALLLLKVLFPLLTSLVQPADEPLDVALVPEPGLVLPPRRCIVRDVDVAVLAQVLFVRYPVFGHLVL